MIRALMAALVVSAILSWSALGVSFERTIAARSTSTPSSDPRVGASAQAGVMQHLARTARRAARRTADLDVFSFRTGPWAHGEMINVNRVGSTNNCSRCALALDSTLDGIPRRARRLFDSQNLREARAFLAARPGIVRRLANDFGFTSLVDDPSKIRRTSKYRALSIANARFAEMTEDAAIARRAGLDEMDFEELSYRSLRRTLRAWPDGAKGIVTIDNAGVGHAMNVLRYNGRTFVLDAQSNIQVTSFKAERIALLRTADVPKDVDLNTFGLNHPFDRR